MPCQISTIAFITEHSEVVRGNRLVTSAMGIYRVSFAHSVPLKITAFESTEAGVSDSMQFGKGDILLINGTFSFENGIHCVSHQIYLFLVT